MSQENVEIVRRMWGRSPKVEDLPALLVEFFDPEIEWHDAPDLPGAAVYQGHEAVRRHFEDWLEGWSDSADVATGLKIEEIRSAGDRVFTRGRYFAMARESGIRIDDTDIVFGVYDLRNGHILRVRQFVDEAKALEAVGLSEQDAHADS
jgi:ketosteroid isomerase-like protein